MKKNAMSNAIIAHTQCIDDPTLLAALPQRLLFSSNKARTYLLLFEIIVGKAIRTKAKPTIAKIR